MQRTLAAILLLASSAASPAAGPVPVALALQTRDARLEVGADGRTILFADRATGTNHAAPKAAAFATVKKGGRVFAATSAAASGGMLALRFGDSGVSATLRVVASGGVDQGGAAVRSAARPQGTRGARDVGPRRRRRR